MGVKISRVNKREIKVVGNQKLKSAKHKIMFDRIEAGTFIIAGAVAGKKLRITGIEPKILNKELMVLTKIGINLKISKLTG